MNLKILLNSLFLALCCCLVGCAGSQKIHLKNSDSLFSYQDASGNFLIKRQIKLENGKFILRSQLFKSNTNEKPLEKTISISLMGSSQKNPVMKPLVTQHSVWFDKKRYFVQHKTNDNTRNLDSIYESPEPKWQGRVTHPFPKSKVFCFYGQLPECLAYYGLLRIGNKNWLPFTLIIDSYPYITEQLANMPDSVFINARVNYDGEFANLHRFTVDLGNQVISYHFNQELGFEKMFWIAQSISMIKTN